MKETLQFSLKFSSRPPQTFIAHQNMLWTLDECDSMDTGFAQLYYSSPLCYSILGSGQKFEQKIGFVCMMEIKFFLNGD